MEPETLEDLATADAGEPDENTPEELERLKRPLARHHMMFLGSGNALPPAARGVVYELLKRLLESGIIEMSQSKWASPIVIVMKKNGVDIRLYIDYRLVN
ncbi:hypothetical protein PybrP1_012413 [[Pythium] brassicae (nom. inval.)]|nr:hypothetical protein PybrP1_012413 [[Pythium] brassicae (nom. inval.)]